MNIKYCDICEMPIKSLNKKKVESYFTEEAKKYPEFSYASPYFLFSYLPPQIKNGDICDKCKKGMIDAFFEWYKKRRENIKLLKI